MNIRARLEKLEAKTATSDIPQFLQIYFRPGRMDVARHDGVTWTPRPDENVDQFYERVCAEFQVAFPGRSSGPTFGEPGNLPGSGGEWDVTRRARRTTA